MPTMRFTDNSEKSKEVMRMVWVKGHARISGKCNHCGKEVNKGDTAFVEIHGILPRPSTTTALCEDCFNQLYPNEKTVSEMGLALRRFTLRAS